MSCIQNNFNFYSTMPPREWFRYAPTPPDYTLHSSEDLAMRRKAEILKYDRNETNKLTKKQKWSMIARGTYSKKKTWSSTINQLSSQGNGLSFSCGSTKTKCAYTTSSNVPGKKMLLCFHETVPLYMYNTQRSYLTGSYKEYSLNPVITPATFEIDSGAYSNGVVIGTIDAQDFNISYSTPLTYEILSGNDSGKFNIGLNDGIITTHQSILSTDSSTLTIQVTNIFDYSTIDTIRINVIDLDTFEDPEIESYSNESLWYPPMDAPTFCEPIYPPFITPEDITVLYPAIVPPSFIFEPHIPIQITPPILPPTQLCNCNAYAY
jgi:hypothetical protein